MCRGSVSGVILFVVLAQGCLLAPASPAQTTNAWDVGVLAVLQTAAISTGTVARVQANAEEQRAYVELALQQELAAEAVRRGLAERFVVQQQLADGRRQVLINALRADVVVAVPAPTMAELVKAYEAQPDVWVHPESYLLDAFELPATDTGLVTRATELSAGQRLVTDAEIAAFPAAAIVRRQDRQRVTESTVAPEIWQALPAMKEDEARVFHLPQGVFFVRRGSQNLPTRMTFDEARPTLESLVYRAKQEEAWQDYVSRRQAALALPVSP